MGEKMQGQVRFYFPGRSHTAAPASSNLSMRKSAYVRYIEKRNSFVQLEFMDLVGGLSYLEFPTKVR
jgi:hypothetical protein